MSLAGILERLIQCYKKWTENSLICMWNVCLIISFLMVHQLPQHTNKTVDGLWCCDQIHKTKTKLIMRCQASTWNQYLSPFRKHTHKLHIILMLTEEIQSRWLEAFKSPHLGRPVVCCIYLRMDIFFSKCYLNTHAHWEPTDWPTSCLC